LTRGVPRIALGTRLVRVMTETAAERKARLRALREEAAAADPRIAPPEPAPAPAAGEPKEPNEPKEPVLKFRNYMPRDEELQEGVMAAVQVEEFAPVEVEPHPLIASEEVDDEVGVDALLPQKLNADLRRDVAQKMEKLERRTQRAMLELMQEEEERRNKEAEAEV